LSSIAVTGLVLRPSCRSDFEPVEKALRSAQAQDARTSVRELFVAVKASALERIGGPSARTGLKAALLAMLLKLTVDTSAEQPMEGP
jgi:hypothetical protein